MRFKGVNYLLLVVLLSCALTAARAQVGSNYSQFMLNAPAFNPAYAGSCPDLEATLFYRNQWTNLSGRTLSTPGFNASMPIKKISSGVGLAFVYDMIGAQRNLYFNASYAYQLKIKKSLLGFGVSGGLIQSTLLGNLLRAPEGNYEDGAFNHNDPIIPLAKSSGISPYLGAGLMFTHKGLQVGASVSSLVEGKSKVPGTLAENNIIFRRNLYGYISYRFKVGKKLNIRPSVLFKSDLKENQLDINALIYYKSVFWAGAGYRGYNKKSNESVILLFGVNILKNLMLGYSYDISLGPLRGANYGSHEIVLSWRQPLKTKEFKPKTIYNPRFL
jgi:type IX secretion system PorP/SprF family membrane protein